MKQIILITQKEFGWAAIILLILVLLNLFFILNAPVLDVDAALYAAMSMELLEKGNPLFLTERGEDYLDKPHLLFWLNALSFKIFGLTNWAYKLPSIVAFGLSLGYLFRFSKILFNTRTAFYSAFILMSSLGLLWIGADLKTDLLLISFLIPATLHLYQGLVHQAFKDRFMFAIFVALAMMTKGVMGLIIPLVLLSPFFFTQREFRKKCFQFPWWWVLLLVVVLCTPVLLGLYLQFDLNPDKVVHGRKGVSGLKFFFWEQSFGRITGENKWRNDAPWFFLFEQLAILMMPFTPLLFVFLKGKRIANVTQGLHYLFLFGALAVLILLSFSQYKIPHYTAVAFPFMSVFLAHRVSSNLPSWPIAFSVLLVFILSLFTSWVSSWSIASLSVTGAFAGMIIIFKSRTRFLLFIAACTLGLLLNAIAIPLLYKHTATPKVVKYLKEKQIEADSVVLFNKKPRSLEFELGERLKVCNRKEVPEYGNYWIYMDEMGLHDLQYDGLKVQQLAEFSHHDPDRIQLSFLNPKSRHLSLQKRYLVKFEKAHGNSL